MSELYSPEQIPQLREPSEIGWEKVDHYYWNVTINGLSVATMEPRPHYCDRGQFIVKCYLPGIDAADHFPRYFMQYDSAVAEMNAWLRWRLWKIRPEDHRG